MRANHFGVSGGKDSTALLLWAVHSSGYPVETVWVTFCDTGWEHDWTYEHVAMLNLYLLARGYRGIEVLHPKMDFFSLAQSKHRFPSPMARFCTQQLKMVPSQEWAFAMCNRGYEVVMHSGVRASESEKRSHLPMEGWDGFYGLKVIRPLLQWTLDEVWMMHELHGLDRNPLYAAGASRVGCFPCMMSRKPEIRMIADRFPDRIDTMRGQEGYWPHSKSMFHSFFARDKVPLRFRSKEITTAKGVKMKVATIDDVVEWSRTGKRAQSARSEQELFNEDKLLSCESSMGSCE